MSEKKPVANLRALADYVGLAPCSVSAVLNQTPASGSIPQHTKDRIFRAAAELNYRPNFSARSLRTKRTNIVAAVCDDFGNSAVGQIVASMERHLRARGYLLTLGTIARHSEWSGLIAQLQQRGIEGVVAVGVSLPRELHMPAVSVHLGQIEGLTPSQNQSSWLADLAESAVETLLSKIETKDATRRTRIVPQFAFGPPVPAGQSHPLSSAQA